jgi:hypothetical protein
LLAGVESEVWESTIPNNGKYLPSRRYFLIFYKNYLASILRLYMYAQTCRELPVRAVASRA